ncbi:MAG: hypothetical protein Unbinned1473contig1001_19 [Prokaryotic dsDNA virus sp.]|nr:MAG: hypothetical protein Unbinned1473contig1001_19 [Prokaryotic dsDNA virus sp.]
MPNVRGKKFPYTKKGISDAKKSLSKKDKKRVMTKKKLRRG